jgi:hypothetical protein
MRELIANIATVSECKVVQRSCETTAEREWKTVDASRREPLDVASKRGDVIRWMTSGAVLPDQEVDLTIF